MTSSPAGGCAAYASLGCAGGEPPLPGGDADKSAATRSDDLLVMEQENEQPAETSQPTTAPMQNPAKPPEEWATGKEQMTGPQRSYLQTLCREAGEDFNENLTKAEASKKIDELQAKTGRGRKA